MVATCARCHREFKQLSKGRLFLLPPVHTGGDSMWKISRLADHCYWLCSECSREYVLERVGTELVVSQRDQLRADRR